MATMRPVKVLSSAIPPVITTREMPPTRYTSQLKSLNKKHAGHRGFLIGGGSSIRTLLDGGFDFSQLKDEITVGVNKAYKLFLPSYLVFGDGFFWKEFYKEIRALSCIKFAPEDIVRHHSDSTLLPVRRSQNYHDLLPRGLESSISFINNSGVAALRILYCLGCNPIYLVGVDLSANQTGSTHFHTEYVPFKRDTSESQYKSFTKEYMRTIAALRTQRVNVISCSSMSSLNTIIPYVPLPSLFLNK